MKLLRLREKLNHVGLTLLRHVAGFKVTDAGVKTPVDLDFRTLAEVEAWIKDQRHANRLTDIEGVEWDARWKAFVEGVKCAACGQTHRRFWWNDSDNCCPSCGEGQNLEVVT